jgi:hypothetical protein
MRSIIKKSTEIPDGFKLVLELDGQRYEVSGSWQSCINQIKEEEQFARYTVTNNALVVNGKACEICGGVERYSSNSNCVNCKRKHNEGRYMVSRATELLARKWA